MPVRANPANFMAWSKLPARIGVGLGLALLIGGLIWGGVFAPPERYQADTVRIIYLHVPTAWLSMGMFLGLGVSGAVYFVWRHTLAALALRAIAPIGACLCAICLITGAIWGKPTWGAYWVWDARLTSMLVLFFLYLGLIALSHAFDDRLRGAEATAILAMVGVLNLPIIKFSVDWWANLHQSASVLRRQGVSIDPSILQPLLLSTLGLLVLVFGLSLLALRTEIVEGQLLAARKRRRFSAPLESPQ